MKSKQMIQIRRKVLFTLPLKRTSLYYLLVTFALISAYLLCLTFNPFISGVEANSGITYYVSKNGNNTNGQSWATAWNELASINWSVVQPGDTILLDGGSQSMTYSTTLTIAKSGTQAAPITIERATETGHNGTVILFGGRSTPLPYCGQKNYVYHPAQRAHAIVFGSSSWIVLDGMNWHGINIHGFSDNGVDMSQTPSNDTLRNMEIYDNGSADQQGNTFSPDDANHGIYLTGSNLTFEQMDIHDNAADEFDTGEPSGVHNITINHSWMHVSREDPNHQGLPFNNCVHQDGYQIYSGGVQTGILIENSVVGPGLGENFILGATKRSDGNSATINDVTIRNVLSIAKDRNILGYPQVNETGWVIDHDTIITTGKGIPDSGLVYEALFLQGPNNSVTNSIFYDGLIYVPNKLQNSSGNCQWKTTGDTNVLGGQTIDPQFTTDISSYQYSTPLATMVNANYALQSISPCKGVGSSITSVNSFLQMVKANNSGSTPTPQAKSTPGSGDNNGQNPIPGGFATIIWVILGLILIGAIALLLVIYKRRARDSIS